MNNYTPEQFCMWLYGYMTAINQSSVKSLSDILGTIKAELTKVHIDAEPLNDEVK